MNKRLKNKLKTILPLALGVFLVYYSYRQTTPADRTQIYHTIKEANYFWVVLSLLAGLLSHLFRAWRWNLLLEPMGYHPRFANNIMAIFIAYLANLGIPRSGEVFRATTISTYEKIPFEKGFGTIVAERIIDLIMLLLVVVTAAAFQTEFIVSYLESKGIHPLKTIAVLAVLGCAGLAFLYFINRTHIGWLQRIRQLVRGLMEGITSIFKMRRKGAFILYTLGIWIMYIVMFWLIKYSIPETIDLGIASMLVAFVAGAFAMSTTNGGIGLYPLAVGKVLVLYGITQTAADSFGWIMWTSQTLMVVILGAFSFLYLPFYNRSK
ncbi:lysylphosphatidylglycerol synthase transmembrane domain-containing protein [Robertkochia sediminum]|uniref:lysylphosphatidylglycerol synthase transmembrane domain-containing protein n=1 Tax=Robertkochia sediminum TaxID=2785326 RepID=UPI00193328E2|nr:lysylphosphatidylglycerol synthase transmembrane domain-containing protein [Robertkochia sediminum]MBL7471947.1 flippase-like domain-containing protein [Robertkochia sediminum]